MQFHFAWCIGVDMPQLAGADGRILSMHGKVQIFENGRWAKVVQVYRLGTYFRPFKSIYSLRNLLVQLKYSYYRKSASAGGISDSYATEDNANVGHAGDLALVYNVKEDVQFFYGFGLFKPGAAYPVLKFDGTDGQAWRYAHLVSLTLIL